VISFVSDQTGKPIQQKKSTKKYQNELLKIEKVKNKRKNNENKRKR
jgi:hypothetical protein